MTAPPAVVVGAGALGCLLAALCSRHDPWSRIRERVSSLRTQYDLCASLLVRDPSYREDLAVIGRALGLWTRALAMVERRIRRTAPRFGGGL